VVTKAYAVAMLRIDDHLSLPLHEIEFTAIRSQGAGGQNVNKTSSAAQLRFDVRASSLPEACKQRLLARSDRRQTVDGVIVIKAQQHRSLEMNRAAALERLAEMIRLAAIVPRVRRATKPTRASQRKRVDTKTQRGRLKTLRRSVDD
jgi:ribosome-associated protein